MNATDIFLRHTDNKGNVWAQMHRVWDKDVFLQTQSDSTAKEGGKVVVLTEVEYQAERAK